jgi:electron transfer flavoprotein alpha subunit
MSGPVLALVEYVGGEADRLSLEALALGRRIAGTLGGPLEAVVVGEEGRDLAPELGAHGVGRVHLVLSDRLSDYAPGAWAASMTHIAASSGAPVVLAAGSDRGNEVMAYLAARLDLPMAANVLDAMPGESFRITRQRWAGSLIEDAQLDARSEERRVGKECPHWCRSRWSPYH